jgi:hypothetical protein
MGNWDSIQHAVVDQFTLGTGISCAHLNTGGGCTAIHIPIEGKGYLLVTDGQAEIPLPDEFETIAVTKYNSSDVEWDTQYFENYTDAINYCRYMYDLFTGRI